MKICPNVDCPDIELFEVQGEYNDYVTHCAKCGEKLEEKPPPLEPEPRPDITVAEPRWIEPELPEVGDFAYIFSFRDLSNAHVAKALLESSGFYVELLDQHTIGMNWLLSQAVCGIKLVVVTDAPDRAVNLLKTHDEHSLDDLPEMSLPPTPFEICPRCGSFDVVRPRWSVALKTASLFWLWLILFYPVAKHFEPTRCSDCERRWHPQWSA